MQNKMVLCAGHVAAHYKLSAHHNCSARQALTLKLLHPVEAENFKCFLPPLTCHSRWVLVCACFSSVIVFWRRLSLSKQQRNM